MSDAVIVESRWQRTSARARRSYLSSTALMITAVLALVTMNELNRLIGEAISRTGRVHPLSEVIGFAPWTGVDAWADWKTAAFSPMGMVITHTAMDVVFIACYAALGFRLLRLAADGPTPPKGLAPQDDSKAALLSIRLSTVLLVLVVGTDLLEDTLLLILSIGLSPALALSAVPPGVLVVVTCVKWVVTALLLVNVLFGSAVGSIVRRFLKDAALALYAQRLGAIVVGAIAAVSLLTANGVLEQVPDVYRGWLQPPADPDLGLPSFNWPAIAFSFVAFAFTGYGLFAIGRERARHYLQRTDEVDTRPDASLTPWLLAAFALLVAGLGFGLFGNADKVDPLTWGAVMGVLLALALGSFVIRAIGIPIPPPLRSLRLANRAVSVRMAGDLLVAVWIAIAALGPYKSLLSPLFLASTLEGTDSSFRNSFGWILAIVVGLAVAAIGLPVLFRALLARGARSLPAHESHGDRKLAQRMLEAPASYARAVASTSTLATADARRARTVAAVAVLLAVLSVVSFLLSPGQAGVLAGPVTVLILLVSAWATLLGVLMLFLARSKPLELFRLLRLRSTPVVTLLVVVPLVLAFVNVPAELHSVRVNESATKSERETIVTALPLWYDAQVKCATTVIGPTGVATSAVPLLMVAAEGGGIRAATWTVDVLRQLPQDGACASAATFLSSGASGGSIGLAAFRQTDNAFSPATMSTGPFGGPDALAADMAGLLAGDLVASVTGIRVPTPEPLAGLGFGPWAWHDRTALQELSWESAAEQLAQPYNSTFQSPTGYVLLNSTDSVSNCKVVISQLDLTPGTPITDEPRCNGTGAELANLLDLEDYIGDCVYSMNWSSAAELSARFPFVSPPARLSNETMPGCNDFTDMQLVDGGLTDNSALGTISDVAPQLVDHIIELNAVADGSPARPFIVPLVIFMSNEPGFDVDAVERTTQPDIVVPLSAIQAAPGGQITPAAWLTRVSDEFASVCPPTPAGAIDRCSDAVASIRGSVGEGAVIAAPSTSPAVSVPLGWSMSDFTRSQLRREAEVQSSCGLGVLSHDLSAYETLNDVPGSDVLGSFVLSLDQLRQIKADCGAGGSYGRLGDVLDLFANSPPTFESASATGLRADR